tara:strand:+ start:113 stop:604 length:492 start_codon:yes stop_codon:yes gene_type:complete
VSTLKTNTIQAATGINVSVASGHVLNAPGHVIAVHQFTASEQTVSSATNLINATFTPKLSGSKFFVHFTIPNITLTSGNYYEARSYIGVDSTPTNNQEVIYTRTSGQGTNASNTQTLSASDFGTYTCPNTNTHYVALRVTPESSAATARHSSTVKLQLMEIAQ